MKAFAVRLFKHALIATLIGVVAVAVWYFAAMRGPARDPNVGKRAYFNEQYLGVVVGSARDPELGEVWIVQPPAGYRVKYRKSRLTLKDQ